MENQSAVWMYKKVRADGVKVVSTPEELATYYRAGRVQGDVVEYIKSNVKQYGYTLVTHHSSINGENIYYFSPEIIKAADNTCYCGKPTEKAMVVCKEHLKRWKEQNKKYKHLV